MAKTKLIMKRSHSSLKKKSEILDKIYFPKNKGHLWKFEGVNSSD